MKLSRPSKTVSYFFSALLIVGLFSCSSKQEEGSEDQSSKFDEAREQLSDQIESVIYEIPPPSEIPWILQSTGADFNGSLIHDNNKSDQYLTTNSKSALNLGIYSTDIGYLSSYEKSQEALNYLTSARALADHLGVTSTFDATLLERFEGNLDSRDSLASIIDEGIGRTDEFLRNDDRKDVAALVLAGSFIEGLYIATSLVKNYPTDLPKEQRDLLLAGLVRIILQQEEPLGNLIELLKTLDQDDMVSGLVADLEGLKANYEQLDVQEKISSGQGGELMEDETLGEITNQVESIRSEIIS